MAEVLIALGSNVGDRLEFLQDATIRLSKLIKVESASHVYETAPMYVEDQPSFLNAVLLARAVIGPRELLCLLKRIEREIGREPRVRNGPREIDLDLISYGAVRYRFIGAEGELEVPHPRVAERRFVLKPAADVAPNLRLPGIGIVSDLLKQTEAQADSVNKVEHAVLPIQR